MHRYDTPRRALAFGIAGLAGFVDATGFLAANSYFVSFMSGNTTRLGIDLATSLRQALVPALLILGFIAGVTLGALLAERFPARRKSVVIGFSTALLVVAAVLRASGHENAFLALAVLAMGALNNAFRRDGEVAVAVTYMTGALVRFGQGLASFLRGQRIPGWLLNAVLWASLALGAVIGAAVATHWEWLSAWAAAGFSGSLLLAALWIERAGPAQPPQSS